MIRRTTLVLASLLLVTLGAVGAWIALTVPRDVRAQSVLRDARTLLRQGAQTEARGKFLEVLENYPRTDAASAAAFALFRIEQRERAALEKRVAAIEQGEEGRGVASEERQAAEQQESAERLEDRARIEQLEKQLAEVTLQLEATKIKAQKSTKK
jgi:hypothetical protein